MVNGKYIDNMVETQNCQIEAKMLFNRIKIMKTTMILMIVQMILGYILIVVGAYSIDESISKACEFIIAGALISCVAMCICRLIYSVRKRNIVRLEAVVKQYEYYAEEINSIRKVIKY